MAKTVEEIKAEVTALVKSQGNQGAISLGTVLDDITELAGEGGGGGSTPNVIQLSSADGVNFTIDNPDDLETFAKKAEQGESVSIKISQTAGQQTMVSVYPAIYSGFGTQKKIGCNIYAVGEGGVSAMSIAINAEQKTVTVQTNSYPS